MSKATKLTDQKKSSKAKNWFINKLPQYVGEIVMISAVVLTGFYLLESYTSVNDRTQGVLVTLFVLGLVWVVKRTPKKK